jgi:hypothetical protein
MMIMKPGNLDFLTRFYEQKLSQQNFIPELGSLLSSEDLTASALPFFSHQDPKDWLRLACRRRGQLSEIQTSQGIASFRLLIQKLPKDSVEKAESGAFFIFTPPEYALIHLLVTLEPSHFFEHLRRFVESSYPKVLTTFVTHRRFQRLLSLFLQKHDLSQLIINRASLRIRFQENEEACARPIVPMVSWPDMDIHRAFDWVKEQNGWFQSLKFTAYRNKRALAGISFSRQGITRTTGLLPEVFSSFIMPVCKILDENVRFFGQRSRRDRKDLSVRPLIIDFESDQVAELEEKRRFIIAMQQMHSASVSVLHGNPYVHLSVLDYYDGSVFDVWVLSPSAITIVPQMKGSIAAIKRIINHVFDSFAEGRIREYEKVHEPIEGY